jgi:hypothetical protein
MCAICLFESINAHRNKKEEEKPEMKAQEAEKEKVEFALWDEKQVSDKPRKVFFKLENEEGNIFLRAVDEDGDRILCGDILAIKPNGEIVLCASVNENIGLKLNSNGEIIAE